MKNNLAKGQKIYFTNEKIPYKVMSVSDRYAVVSRKLNKRQDADLLKHEVEMSAFCSFTEAYNAYKNNPIYSIIDFKEQIRAPHNLIFGDFDYSKEKDCDRAI